MLAVAVRWQCPLHVAGDTHCPHYVSTSTGAGRFNECPITGTYAHAARSQDDPEGVDRLDWTRRGEVGQRIRDLRIERALTQKVLAL